MAVKAWNSSIFGGAVEGASQVHQRARCVHEVDGDEDAAVAARARIQPRDQHRALRGPQQALGGLAVEEGAKRAIGLVADHDEVAPACLLRGVVAPACFL
jgi:hypothetical protein